MAVDANWPGDYHWARCDNSSDACDSWSQKDGSDQVTNFDFAGNPINNPMTANLQVTQGPVSSTDSRELLVEYGFYCFMFVPETSVTIIQSDPHGKKPSDQRSLGHFRVEPAYSQFLCSLVGLTGLRSTEPSSR